MGRMRAVDGSPTETITLRLPTWAIERAEQNAERIPVREYLRSVIVAHLTRGYEVRGEDSFGE